METLTPEATLIQNSDAQQAVTLEEAARVSAELTVVADEALYGAQAVVAAESKGQVEANERGYGSVTRETKLGAGVLDVVETTVAAPLAEKGGLGNLLAGGDSVPGERRSTTVESTIKSKFFGLKSTPSVVGHESEVSQTGLEDTKFSETKNGQKRDVKRTVTVGKDGEGNPTIKVDQVSTDKQGNNPRETSWSHTEESPSRVAVKAAEVIGKRVASKQPKPAATSISM